MDDLVKRLRERDIAAWSDAYSCRARGVEAADAIEALTARAEAAEARVAELEARLEIDHYFVADGDDLTRHEATPEERRTLPDKIDCLEDDLELGKGRIASARNKALEDAAKVAEGFNPSPLPLVEYRTSNIAAAIRALKSSPRAG